MKKLLNLFPAFLIILGSALEILYYTKRFQNDGIELYLSIIIGVSLTLFLSMLMLKRTNFKIWILIIPLAVYSVICTAAGQSFSLSELRNDQIIDAVQEENRQQEIDEYLKDIDFLNNDLNQLSSQITTDTTWSRNKYAEAIEAIQERQDKIKEEKRILQDKIGELRAMQTVNETIKKESTNIYQFYNSLFGLNPTYLQFFLQTLLSFFIAAMAPLGIVILSTKKKEPVQQHKKRKINYLPLIKRWVTISWTGHRKNNNYRKILDKSQFLKYYNDKYLEKKEQYKFTESLYDKINNAGIDIKCVDKKGDIVNNYSEEQIINLIHNKLK